MLAALTSNVTAPAASTRVSRILIIPPCVGSSSSQLANTIRSSTHTPRELLHVHRCGGARCVAFLVTSTGVCTPSSREQASLYAMDDGYRRTKCLDGLRRGTTRRE